MRCPTDSDLLHMHDYKSCAQWASIAQALNIGGRPTPGFERACHAQDIAGSPNPSSTTGAEVTFGL